MRSLKNITNNVLSPNSLFLDRDIQKNKILNKKINEIQDSNLSHIQKIFFLLEDCKKYGTLPFSGIARCSFIATKFVKSLKDNKLISDQEYEGIFKNINTVSTQINSDYLKLLNKKISKIIL